MKTSLFVRCRTLARPALSGMPAAMLIAFLQRGPALRVVAAAEEIVAATPVGAVLRAALASVAALGSLHTLAGATVLAASRQSPTVNVNEPIATIGFTVTDTINIGSWKIGGNIPPGLMLAATQNPSIFLTGAGTLDATTAGSGGDPYDPYGGGGTPGNPTTTPILMGTPTTAGVYTFSLQAFEFGGLSGLVSNTFNYTVTVAGATPPPAPSVNTQPSSQAATPGGSVTLNVAASGNPTIQWRRNGSDVSGATDASYTLANLQPASTGIYTALLTNAGGSVASTPAIVGLNIATKVVGDGAEIGTDIVFAGNGNIFDQVSIAGPAIAVTSDAGQVLRTSCIDGNGDIIQIEFFGPGTVSVVLDGANGPVPPAKYNQAATYWTGNVGIVISGATENTNLSVFSVGRATAVNQGLFKSDVTYDGFADIAFVAISSANGRFGGLRMANTSFVSTHGYTGIYAPGVQFNGPVFVGDINAFDAATPVILLGGVLGTGGPNSVANEVRITGGDLDQTNGRAIQVSGFTRLLMSAGTTSHYTGPSTPSQFINFQTNKGHLELDGQDVTSLYTKYPDP